MSKKYFRPAVRILKLSKSFKILLIERAVGFLPPAHTPPLLCPGHLLRGFLTVSEMPMTIFEAVKTTVTPRMAADHFGLSVNRNGMVCYPFHDDRHPSMKLYENHSHCFGCQANGDVIAFTSKLFGITLLEAAQKLAADFGIREDRPSVLAKLRCIRHRLRTKSFAFGCSANICTFCRIGKRDTHRRHRRRSRMTVSWKPVICTFVLSR